MSNVDASPFRDLDYVPLGLAVLDRDFRVLFWNSCLETWTGLPRSQTLGVRLGELIPEWQDPQYSQRLSQVFEGGPPVLFSPLLHPDIVPRGTLEDPVYNVKATSLPEGGGWLALLSVEDITVLSQRIVKLRQLQKQSELLMREIHHRVKNNLNMISSLITLQADVSEGATVRALEDLQSRIIAISQIHDVLYKNDDLNLGKAADYLGPLARLLNRNLSLAGRHDLILDLDPEIVFDTDTTIQMGLIQAELMTNALKYGFPAPGRGKLTLTLKRTAGALEYTLAQSGNTLPPDFDPRRSTGLGMQLILTYAQQLGCDFLWTRGDPTTFTLRFRR